MRFDCADWVKVMLLGYQKYIYIKIIDKKLKTIRDTLISYSYIVRILRI